MTKIQKALELGKIKGATVLLKEFYENENKVEWNRARMEEYEGIFPSTREMTDEEKDKNCNGQKNSKIGNK